MKKGRILLLALPLTLACGPFFYWAPPPLHHYPERTPGKSWQRLLDQQHVPSEETKDQLVADCHDLVDNLGQPSAASALERIERLRQRNRDGEFSIKAANFLIEASELVASHPDDAAAADYLRERLEDLPGAGFVSPPPTSDWRLSADENKARMADYHKQLELRNRELQRKLETAPAHLRPYRLVRRGAHHYRSAKLAEAVADFEQVLREFADHPRAEVALFMLGRCQLAQARQTKAAIKGDGTRDKIAAWQQELWAASRVFQDYLKRYPDGRFASDAHGWMGGALMDMGHHAGALGRQIKRLELQATREVAYSAMRETDVILEHWITGGQRGYRDPGLFDRLVRFPALTRQVVYHCLDVQAQESAPGRSEMDDGGYRAVDGLRSRLIGSSAPAREVLEELADALLRSSSPVDAYSAMVTGWSLVRSGRGMEALVLIERLEMDPLTDELLQLKAVALSKGGRHLESAKVFGELCERYPESPLAQASRFDLALEWLHAGEAGEAWLVMLDELSGLDHASTTPEEGPLLHSRDEILQWVDTIAQFSPLDELRRTLERMPADAPHRDALRGVVRSRLLCVGQFAAARQHLDPAGARPWRGRPARYWDADQWLFLDAARWDRDLAALVETSERLADAEGAAKAACHLELGRHWLALRGRVTLPLHGQHEFFHSEQEKLDTQRRENARAVGISDAQAVAELDSRDEWQHALDHFRAVLAIPQASSATRREALFAANETLFRLAEFSPYRLSRVVEQQGSARSAEWVRELKIKYPDSDEARTAVAYEFVPPVLLGEWMPGNRAPWILDEIVEQAVHGGSSRYGDDSDDNSSREKARQVLDQLRRKLTQLARTPAQYPAATMVRVRDKFEALRPQLDREQILSIVDTIDDLHAAAHVEGVSPQAFADYVSRRRGMNASAMADGDALQPFVRYIQALQQAERAIDTAGKMSVWESYLATHPSGPKSEAAALRLLRLQVRQVVAYPRFRVVHFPQAPIACGYKTISFGAGEPAVDEALSLLLEKIKAYRQAPYYSGRYRADADLLEASVLAMAGHPAEALPLLAGILDKEIHRELHQDAGLALCAVAMSLLEPDHRPAMIAALRQHPLAIKYITLLADGDTPVSRLRPMLPGLRSSMSKRNSRAEESAR